MQMRRSRTPFCLRLRSSRAAASQLGTAPRSQSPNDHLYQLGFVPGGFLTAATMRQTGAFFWLNLVVGSHRVRNIHNQRWTARGDQSCRHVTSGSQKGFHNHESLKIQSMNKLDEGQRQRTQRVPEGNICYNAKLEHLKLAAH